MDETTAVRTDLCYVSGTPANRKSHSQTCGLRPRTARLTEDNHIFLIDVASTMHFRRVPGKQRDMQTECSLKPLDKARGRMSGNGCSIGYLFEIKRIIRNSSPRGRARSRRWWQ